MAFVYSTDLFDDFGKMDALQINYLFSSFYLSVKIKKKTWAKVKYIKNTRF